MHRFCTSLRAAVLFLALGLLFAPRLTSAQVMIDSAVTFDGTLYHYAYSLTNDTPDDIAIATLTLGSPANLTGLVAPVGFGIDFDSGLNLVSFFEDSEGSTPQTFAPGSTISGFLFQSALGPADVPFEALDVNASSFTGTTRGPSVAITAVPEPGAVALLLGLSTGLGGFALRRRRK